jgi:hypothetical protein
VFAATTLDFYIPIISTTSSLTIHIQTLNSLIKHISTTFTNSILLHSIKMLYPIRVLLASCAVTMVAAGCYRSGDEGNKQTALNGLDTACKAVQGYFAKKQERYKCVGSETDTTFWLIGVSNTKSDGATLDLQTCKDRLTTEINGCSAKGGENSHDGWWAR